MSKPAIGHFGKYHNTLCLSPKFYISIVSSFSWDLQWSQKKTKIMLMQNLGGQIKSIMVFSEVAYEELVWIAERGSNWRKLVFMS